MVIAVIVIVIVIFILITVFVFVYIPNIISAPFFFFSYCFCFVNLWRISVTCDIVIIILVNGDISFLFEISICIFVVLCYFVTCCYSTIIRIIRSCSIAFARYACFIHIRSLYFCRCTYISYLSFCFLLNLYILFSL